MMRRSSVSLLRWNDELVAKSFTSKHPTLHVTSPLTFSQATEVHNTQITPSCAFVSVLSCAQRHEMLANKTVSRPFPAQPGEKLIEDFKANQKKGREGSEEAGTTTPHEFASHIFEHVSVTKLRNSAVDVAYALENAAKVPCVFPCLPVTKKGAVVVYSREDFVKAYYDMFQKRKDRRVWHSQCVVGTAFDSANGERYFVCLQSWKDSVLTFVPAMSYEEILDVSKNNRRMRITHLNIEFVRYEHRILVPTQVKAEYAPSEAMFTASKGSGQTISDRTPKKKKKKNE